MRESSKEEWGPWIDHDGSGYPVPEGTLVELEFLRECGFVASGVRLNQRGKFRVARCKRGGSWVYGSVHNQATWSLTSVGSRAMPIIRYRVKKPKGLTILEGLIQNLPEPTNTEERV